MTVFLENIYCINLNKHRKRKETVLEEIKQFDENIHVTIFPAIEMKENPARGCGLSICSVIKKYGIEKNAPFIVLCEDDIEFVKNAKYKIQQALENIPEKSDILLGGSYNLNCSPISNYNSHWLKIGDFASTHFMIIFDTAYQKIISYETQTKYNNIDRYIGQTFSRSGLLHIYIMWPMPVKQRDGYSSIQNKIVSYNTQEWNLNHRLIWYNHGIHKDYHFSLLPPPVHFNSTYIDLCKKKIDILQKNIDYDTFEKEWPYEVLPGDHLYWCTQMKLYSRILKKQTGIVFTIQ